MRALFLLALSIATATFAGCVGEGGPGLSALDAAEALDDHAIAWAPDAVLVRLGAYEMAMPEIPAVAVEAEGGAEAVAEAQAEAQVEAEAAEDMDDPAMALAASDESPGDGKAPAWMATYYSAERGMFATLVANADRVMTLDEVAVPEGATTEFSPESLAAAGDARTTWTVDSTDALAALRGADASLAEAFDTSQPIILYHLSLVEPAAWTLTGQAGTLSFHATVDVASAEVSDLVVEEGSLQWEDLDVVVGAPKPRLPPPAPISESGTTTVSLDPLNLVIGAEPCSTPTARCAEIPFTLEDSYQVDVTLTWGVAAHDYDLYVLDSEGNMVVTSGAVPPGTSESGSAQLEAGEYVILVVAWAVVQDSWNVEATFA